MRKILLAGAALLSLGAALPAYAQTVRTDIAPAAGATTGATLGFLFGGPIGAVIGGFSGAAIGTAVDNADVTYVGTHPVEQVYINGDIGVGYKGLNVLESTELRDGIKVYSNWPTIPQLYVKGEFVGGCDIVREMFQAGELQQLFAEKGIVVGAPASA